MKNQNFEYIRETYSVPAEKNRLIEFNGRKGIIIQPIGQYLGVVFFDKPTKINSLHPTYNVTYSDKFGTQPKITRSQQRYRDYIDLGYAENYSFAQYMGFGCKPIYKHHEQ